MSVALRVLRGTVRSLNNQSEQVGYVRISAVTGNSGGVMPVPYVKDLDGHDLLVGAIRVDFGQSPLTALNRDVPLGWHSPTPALAPTTGAAAPVTWQVPLVPTDTTETDPTGFAYLVQVFVENTEIARKVIEIPTGTTPIEFNDLVSAAPGGSLFGSLVTWADFEALTAEVTQALSTIDSLSGPPLIEDSADPGTYTILQSTLFSEDPSDPGTYLIGA